MRSEGTNGIMRSTAIQIAEEIRAKYPQLHKLIGESLTGQNTYEFLEPGFLEAMNDIGRYGHEKYGEQSYQARRENGDRSRNSPRTASSQIFQHAQEHFVNYARGGKHDHFGSRKHELAAVAFNAMMEFYFEGLEDEDA